MVNLEHASNINLGRFVTQNLTEKMSLQECQIRGSLIGRISHFPSLSCI